MRANRSDHHLYETFLKTTSNKKDNDTISFVSLNTDTKTNSTQNHRILATKRLHHSNDSKPSDLFINGSLFDQQLFQPSRSSYILDYGETPRDLNRFLEGHNTSEKSSNLDSHLFKISFIITFLEWHVDKELLLDYCPREEKEIDIVKEISYYKHFCFPELISKETNGENFIHPSSTYVFTRTNSNGQVEYGYCRRISDDNNQITKFPIVICIVSEHSCFKLYDAILSEFIKAYISNDVECNLLMQSFYSKPFPIPTTNSSGIACILNGRRVFFYTCPNDDRLNHDYFSTLLSCLSPSNMILLFESILCSKRILCFSQSYSKLTKSCLALSFLIYPFIWPYPFVSLMPSSWLHDLLDSPCPYIYGCLYETMKNLPSTIDTDTICVDLDSNTIHMNTDENYFILPSDLRQTLQASLEYLTRFRLIKLDSIIINIGVSEAFLRVFIELFYRLPDFFKRHQKSNENQRNCQLSPDTIKSDENQSTQKKELIKTKIKHEENRLDYEFHSDDFLISQPLSSYVNFLNDFIRGMIFLKFLDDYQRIDNNSKQSFSLFLQRLNERRRMTAIDLSINSILRFRQTFELLEKQIKQSSKSTRPIFSTFVKKLFE